MARKTNTKNRTELQKSQFSETVVRTLKAKIILPDITKQQNYINKNTFYINKLTLKNEKILIPGEVLRLKQFNDIKLKIQETEKILQFFAQSLGNVRFLWNHFLALTQQKYRDFKTLSEDEKSKTAQVEVQNKNTQEIELKEKPLHTSYYTKYELLGLLTQFKKDEKTAFLNYSHSQSLQNVVEILSDSLVNSIQKRKNGEKSEVRFKKKKDDSSFTIKQVNESHINLKKGTILLPKLKKELRFNASLKKRHDEKIKTIQIVKEGKNWFICFTLEKQETTQEKLQRLDNTLKTLEENLFHRNEKEKFSDVIGFDFGVNTFLTSNTGKKYTLPQKIIKKLQHYTDRLHRIQQQSSKKQLIRDNIIKEAKAQYKTEKGSLDGFKASHYIEKEKLQASNNEMRLFELQRRLYKKISNLKQDFLHKLSNTLSKSHAVLVFEKLNMKRMTRSQRRINLESSPEYKEKLKAKLAANPAFKKRWTKNTLNRMLLHLPFGKFISQLSYKMQREAHVLIQVDPAYTSQQCCECLHTEEANRPEQSTFCCVKCGHSEHADVNAGKNIRRKGLPLLPLIYTELMTLKNTFICEQNIRDVKPTSSVKTENSVVV